MVGAQMQVTRPVVTEGSTQLRAHVLHAEAAQLPQLTLRGMIDPLEGKQLTWVHR